jgi:hypothetical protein
MPTPLTTTTGPHHDVPFTLTQRHTLGPKGGLMVVAIDWPIAGSPAFPVNGVRDPVEAPRRPACN